MKLRRGPMPPVSASLAGVLTAPQARAAAGCRVTYTITSQWPGGNTFDATGNAVQADIVTAGYR